jgi:alpha-mannosidase
MHRSSKYQLSLFIASLFLLLTSQAAAGQKRFYIAPDDHTDYFWTGTDVQYRQAFLAMTDYYLNKMDATQANPPDTRMRWNCDGSLWMWEYERNRTPAQFERFLSRIRDGRMSVALNPLVLVQGGAPAESVLRGMYYPGLIERRHNVKFPIAIAMENQTLPLGLSSLWAGAGAKYSWKGVCNCASDIPNLNNRDREIYYSGGLDGSRILMKWQSILTTNQMFGGYAEAFDPMQSILFAENNTNFRNRYPFPVIGAFGSGWDDLQYLSDEFVTVAQQNSNANRRIIVSNQEDFFRDFETNHGSGLETFTAAFGNDWDIFVASMPEVSARIKRSTEKLRAAEAMATLVSLDDPGFMTPRIPDRDQAMMNLGLYYEHDWTADSPIISRTTRANWSRSVEKQVSAYVDKLHYDAKAQLARRISRSGNELRFFVFNPLSWTRTDFADIPLPSFMRKARAVDVSTGQEVPSQIIRQDGKTALRVLAADVPSVGYKVFEIRNGLDTANGPAATVSGATTENQFYRLTLAPDGAIISLIDKTRGNRQVVRSIDGKVINDLGGNRTGTVVLEESGPVSVTLMATSNSPVRHITRVTLYRGIDRIDISNEITQNFGDVKTWNYSFDINTPDMWHEEVGAVIRAKLLNAGGHYAPRNARYDWLTMNHFADISDGANFGVTVSNWDNMFMRYGDSELNSLDTTRPQINVLAGGQTSGPTLGIPNQGGDSYFLQRFALATHGAYSQTDAMKMSLEHQNPFVAGMIEGTGIRNRVLPAANYSFLTINDPNVLLWALKPAEDGIGQGVIARVWNQANSPTSYQISLDRPITFAQQTTHIETPIASGSVIAGSLNAFASQQQIQSHLLRITP